MKKRRILIFLLSIFLIFGILLTINRFSRDNCNASLKDGFYLNKINLKDPILNINGTNLYLDKKIFNEDLNSFKSYKENITNKYMNSLIDEGVSKKNIELFLKEKEINLLNKQILQKLEEELILQDALNKKIITNKEKDNLDEESFNNFYNEYKNMIINENIISNKDLNNFIDENLDNLIYYKFKSNTYIGKEKANNGQSKTYIENDSNHLSYEGFNFSIPNLINSKNNSNDLIYKNIKNLNSGEISNIIALDDYNIEYSVIFVEEKDNNPYNHIDNVKEIMNELFFLKHMEDLLYSSNIELLLDIDMDILNKTIENPKINLDEKKDIISNTINDLFLDFSEVDIIDLNITEDNTLLYINKPIKKYANIDIVLDLKFNENFDLDEKEKITQSINNSLYKEINNMGNKKGFPFEENINSIDVNFFDINNEEINFLNFGYTSTEDPDFKTPEPLHDKEEFVLKETFNIIKRKETDNNEILLENFGLVDETLCINIFIGDDDENNYLNVSSLLLKEIETFFTNNKDALKYINDLNIEKVKIKFISNWYDTMIREF